MESSQIGWSVINEGRGASCQATPSYREGALILSFHGSAFPTAKN